MPTKDERIRTIGARVRAARVASGQTQTHLAGKVGVHRTRLSAIEAGRANMTVATLYGLADNLGVPITDLLAP